MAQRRKRRIWTWRPVWWQRHGTGGWARFDWIAQGTIIPNGLSWNDRALSGIFVWIRFGPWVRRFRVRVYRPGLARELTDWRGLTCPWLSRTAGAPVLRPDAYVAVSRRTAEVTTKIAAAFEAFGTSIRQAAEAFKAFGAVLKDADTAARNRLMAANGPHWNA